VKSKSIYWKYLLLKIKYIFLRDSYVCPKWILIFDNDQAQINSVGTEGTAQVRPTCSIFEQKEKWIEPQLNLLSNYALCAVMLKIHHEEHIIWGNTL
jgi:hypothetical protein